MGANTAFDDWLKTVCFQKPTFAAYDLAKAAWEMATQLEYKRLYDLVEDRRVYESQAAVHHAKHWHVASEHHITRASMLVDVKAMFEDTAETQLPAIADNELSGMWENADVKNGETDQDQSLVYLTSEEFKRGKEVWRREILAALDAKILAFWEQRGNALDQKSPVNTDESTGAKLSD